MANAFTGRRILSLVFLAVLLIIKFGFQAGGGGASQPSPQRSAANGSAGSASAGPSQIGLDTTGAMLDGMIADLGARRSMRVQFTGSDSGGPVSFDILTDGAGNLTGGYSRNGFPASIVVIGGTVYMTGDDAVREFTGLPVDPALKGWIRLPAAVNPGILGTVASAGRLQECVRQMRDRFPSFEPRAPQVIGGVSTRVYGRTDPNWPWEYALDPSATPPRLVGWQYLAAGTGPQLPACTNGVPETPGAPSGITGVFTFSGFGTPVPPVTAPGAAVVMADPRAVPDPHMLLPGQTLPPVPGG